MPDVSSEKHNRIRGCIMFNSTRNTKTAEILGQVNLKELVPSDMKVPPLRLETSLQNVTWLCRNLMVQNKNHPEAKQTMAKLVMVKNKVLLLGDL